MKAAPHGAVHDAGQPHVDRTGCHARRPLGGITGAGRRGGSSAAGFRWPSLAFRSQIYYFRSSRESEARTCTHRADGQDPCNFRGAEGPGTMGERVVRRGVPARLPVKVTWGRSYDLSTLSSQKLTVTLWVK